MATAYIDSGGSKVETTQAIAGRERRRHERRVLRANAFLLLPGSRRSRSHP